MYNIIKNKIANVKKDKLYNLQRQVIELNTICELKKVFKWTDDPILDRSDINEFDYIEDVNERRIRDAESLATVMRNSNPSIALEIGTANGIGTVLMAVNAPNAKIYTVNISAEEIISGQGGKLTTIALEKENIGFAYRERGLSNIIQIYANTAKWNPDIGTIDVAYIDGCHDTEFVYNDTKKIIKCMKNGSFIMWHDFNLELVKKYGWINEVCLGVEKLYTEGLLKGRIYHLRDSWVGVYQV